MTFVSVIKREVQRRKVLSKLTGSFTPHGDGYVRAYFSVGMRGDFNTADVELDVKKCVVRVRFSDSCKAKIYKNKYVHLSSSELYDLIVTAGVKKINFTKGGDGWFYGKI